MMQLKKILFSIFIATIIITSCLLNAVWAIDTVPNATMSDVALSDGGTLQGRVLDNQSAGLVGVPVTLRTQDRDVAQTTTAADGQFAVQNLRGGVYHVAAAQGGQTFRLWAPRTAPPTASKNAIVYVQNNGAGGGLKAILGNPIVLPAIIATAIAVPIAVSSSQHPASP
jgi:hypothetical protein